MAPPPNIFHTSCRYDFSIKPAESTPVACTARFRNPAFTFCSCTLSPTHSTHMYGSLPRPGFTGPYGPTTRHGTLFPGPHAITSWVTSPHQGHVPCSRYDSASLITAHPLTSSWHVPRVPSFQAGPSAPALTRMAWTPLSRPPPDPVGPSARPGLGWARTHLGPPVTTHGPAPRGTTGPNASREPGPATSKANCGRAEAASSRCRCVPPGCHNDRASC